MKQLLTMILAVAFLSTAVSVQAQTTGRTKKNGVAMQTMKKPMPNYQKTTANTHGKQVSTTAKTTPAGKEMKNEHGKTVNSVARANNQTKMSSTSAHKGKAPISHHKKAIKHHHKKHHKHNKKASTKK